MTPQRILLVGAGRMGQRHLRGLAAMPGEIHVVDPNPQALTAAGTGDTTVTARVVPHETLEGALAALGGGCDGAILAATAAGRLEAFERVAAHGIRHVLAEKPLEQSRRRCRAVLEIAERHGVSVHCNLYRRTLPAFQDLRGAGPLSISVNTGAIGLGCGGIHWIDFALYLSGGSGGRLLFGEVEPETIASGRGPQFRDYGGRGLFAFEDGSRLYLSVRAASSAPTSCAIVGPACHWLIDQDGDTAIVRRRKPGSVKPNYLYGQDYEAVTETGAEAIDLVRLTGEWLHSLRGGPPCRIPTLQQAAPAHELLFDLLETSHETEFAFT